MRAPVDQKLWRAKGIRAAVFVHDLGAVAIAFMLGLAMRVPFTQFDQHITNIALFTGISGIVGMMFGLNRGVWRYASLADIEAILMTSVVTVFSFAALLFSLNRLENVPRATLVVACAMMIVLLSAGRVAYRLYRNWRARRTAKNSTEVRTRGVLLIGATENAEGFIKAVSERPDLPYSILGMIDERGRRTGLSIRGVKVLGNLSELEAAIKKLEHRALPVDGIVLTKPSLYASRQHFNHIAKVAKEHQIELLRLPEYTEVQPGALADTFQPRPIVLSDLLPRRPVSMGNEPIKELVKGARVLVTGAGGSIGSELCRQLAELEPERLVLVDSAEYLLYEIDRELQQLNRPVKIVARIGNVRDRRQISMLFEEQRPDIVFHAAALKHVPIVEAQPMEGLATNAIGTRNVADAAVAINARAMVLISTDKAINPTNMMGAAKRMAEIYCQSLDLTTTTRFVTVRFGNVLGSAGSVVPLFERQIRAGGPVTVTHPEIERYFMTIPEAVLLVLHATGHGIGHPDENRGNIFVLDMGRPVKIVEMARKMIRLAGFEPDVDIAITFTGLRPGEKLFEELFDTREPVVATGVDGVLAAAIRPTMGRPIIAAMFDDLAVHLDAQDLNRAVEVVRKLVPEYQPGEHLEKRIARGAQLQVVTGGRTAS